MNTALQKMNVRKYGVQQRRLNLTNASNMSCNCGGNKGSGGCKCKSTTSIPKYTSQINWDGGAFQCLPALDIPECATLDQVILAILQAVCDSQGGSAAGGYNIVAPSDDGDINNFTINETAGNDSTGDQQFFVDRIGCEDDIFVTLTSANGFIFSDTGTNITTIAQNTSSRAFVINYSADLPPGTYPFTLSYSACGVVKVQNCNLILS